MRYHYEGCLKGNLRSIQALTGHLIHTLEKLSLDEATLFDLRLVLSELLINSYEHGNRANQNKQIFVKLYLEEREIVLSVRDEGAGFEIDCEDPTDLCSCSGRGLMIVKRLADTVQVNDNWITAVLSHSDR